MAYDAKRKVMLMPQGIPDMPAHSKDITCTPREWKDGAWREYVQPTAKKEAGEYAEKVDLRDPAYCRRRAVETVNGAKDLANNLPKRSDYKRAHDYAYELQNLLREIADHLEEASIYLCDEHKAAGNEGCICRDRPNDESDTEAMSLEEKEAEKALFEAAILYLWSRI